MPRSTKNYLWYKFVDENACSTFILFVYLFNWVRQFEISWHVMAIDIDFHVILSFCNETGNKK